MGCLNRLVAWWCGFYSPTNLKGWEGIWKLFCHSAQADYLNYIFKYVWYLHEAQSKNVKCVIFLQIYFALFFILLWEGMLLFQELKNNIYKVI